jgi:hypothetical protein
MRYNFTMLIYNSKQITFEDFYFDLNITDGLQNKILLRIAVMSIRKKRPEIIRPFRKYILIFIYAKL